MTVKKPIPVSIIMIPMIMLIMSIIPNFFTFVRNSMNGMPPTMGTSTASSGMNTGINPSIANTITTTK